MRGAGGTHDCFEGEPINRFCGRSISFQAAQNDAEHSTLLNMRKVQSAIKTIKTHYFWSSVKNLESDGVEGITKKPPTPTTIENSPSYLI